MSHTTRPYDVVLLGATGFTGRLVAEYLNTAYPPGAETTHGLTWAVVSTVGTYALYGSLLVAAAKGGFSGGTFASLDNVLVEARRSHKVSVSG